MIVLLSQSHSFSLLFLIRNPILFISILTLFPDVNYNWHIVGTQIVKSNRNLWDGSDFFLIEDINFYSLIFVYRTWENYFDKLIES